MRVQPDDWVQTTKHGRVSLSAVVLASSERAPRDALCAPQPLHRLCGRPMILHVIDALAQLPVANVVVVVGDRGEWVTKALADHAPPSLSWIS